MSEVYSASISNGVVRMNEWEVDSDDSVMGLKNISKMYNREVYSVSKYEALKKLKIRMAESGASEAELRVVSREMLKHE